MADNVDTIAADALRPKSVTTEQGSYQLPPVADQLEAERVRKAQAAASKPLGGVRLTRVIPPSSTGPGG